MTTLLFYGHIKQKKVSIFVILWEKHTYGILVCNTHLRIATFSLLNNPNLLFCSIIDLRTPLGRFSFSTTKKTHSELYWWIIFVIFFSKVIFQLLSCFIFQKQKKVLLPRWRLILNIHFLKLLYFKIIIHFNF